MRARTPTHTHTHTSATYGKVTRVIPHFNTPYYASQILDLLGLSKFKGGGQCPPIKISLGGGNDKLAIDKGGNLPEKVENHCSI